MELDAHTYHCACTNLAIATIYNLEQLPRRKGGIDNAIILPLFASDRQQKSSSLLGLVAESMPVVVRREDGFDKRVLLKCFRCDLTIGYKLSAAHFPASNTAAEEVVYILPGALTDTEDMKMGRTPAIPSWAVDV